jgi:hypothetical protein
VIDEPQSTTAWAKRARGEELLAKRLDSLGDRGVLMLHDRRIPGSRANLEHIAVSPAGVFVIDAKRYQGRPHMRYQSGLRRARTETLMVGTRDCSKLLDGVTKQVILVRSALADAGQPADLPVRGMLCFIDADWPLIGGSFTTAGVDVLGPKKAAERICGLPCWTRTPQPASMESSPRRSRSPRAIGLLHSQLNDRKTRCSEVVALCTVT